MKRIALITALLLILAGCTGSPTGSTVLNVPEVEVPEDGSVFLSPELHRINISQWHFRPDTLTIYQGDTVKWRNDMGFVKQVWIWGEEPSPVIMPRKSWSFTFKEPGFYKFIDNFQQYMDGNITVLPYEERPDIKAKLEVEGS